MQSVTCMATDTPGGPSGSLASPPGPLMLPRNMGRKEGTERPGTAHGCERPCSWPPVLLTLTLAPVPPKLSRHLCSKGQVPLPVNLQPSWETKASPEPQTTMGGRCGWESSAPGPRASDAQPEQGLSSRSWTRWAAWSGQHPGPMAPDGLVQLQPDTDSTGVWPGLR